MSHLHTQSDAPPTPPGEAVDRPRSPSGRRGVVLLAAAAVAVAVVLLLLTLADGDGGPDGQAADLSAQGGGEPILAEDAATIVRRADGLFAEVDAVAPEPGTYEYPTADMIPPDAEPHPPVSAGASDAPEVFTVWLFAFNAPEECTEGICDLDDVGADTAALGGAYQLDGRIAVDGRLEAAGTVRLGQTPGRGATLTNPLGAEIHLAVAPHGRALAGPDGARQLNGPIGNPDLWWVGVFVAPGS